MAINICICFIKRKRYVSKFILKYENKVIIVLYYTKKRGHVRMECKTELDITSVSQMVKKIYKRFYQK